jgi:two-component system response regulator GlrR
LKVVSLYLPPLEERQEDVLLLAAHFLETSVHEYKRQPMRFSRDAVQKLLSYTWPGNVRELENTIREAVVLAKRPVLRARDIRLSADLQQTSGSCIKEPFQIAKARVVESFERTYLKEIVAAAGGNISLAARLAKKNRRAFFALLKKHGFTSNCHKQLHSGGLE